MLAWSAHAQPAPQLLLPILDVPFISQSEALCGGAAAAMVLRYWGERGVDAESFASLVDRSAAGIRAAALMADLRRRGWNAFGIEGAPDLIARELALGRPVLTLIEDRPGTLHYIVIVAAMPRAIVFHDPARAPFRVMTRDEFGRAWAAANRWMAVIVPGQRLDTAAPGLLRDGAPGVSPDERRLTESRREDAAGATACEPNVAEGVRLAETGDLAGAERVLGSALSCPGGGALRELAGVRLLQRRWPEVTELAAAAVGENPGDAHAWRLLATGRFLQNDRQGALEAWNRIDEPSLDLVAVNGLARTRQRVVEDLMDVSPGDVLTVEQFARAARRLADLPSAALSRLEYVPVPSGLAELRATVVERPLLPSGWSSYLAIGVAASARRELEVSIGSPTGGGERVDLSWRFWPNRPRLGAALEAPAPWGGVWAVNAFAERQPFDVAGMTAARRVASRISASSWVTSGARLSVTAGSDRWESTGTLAHAGAEIQLAGKDDRIIGHAGASAWTGATTFSAIDLGIGVRSSRARRGMVHIIRTGGAVTTEATPLDLWFAGDTGHARQVLLRAHPLLDEGRLRVDRLGRRMLHASAETQHWWGGPAGIGAAGALFIDAAAVDRRLPGGVLRDVDLGIGARIAVPGARGIFRVDLAKGLRDGATTWSFVYEP